MKKKLLEIITRHLAPPARLAAFLLAAFTVGGAWAATPVAAWSDFRTLTSGNYTWTVGGDSSVDSNTGVLTIGSTGGLYMEIDGIGSASGGENRTFSIAIEAEIPSFNSAKAIVDLIVNNAHVSAEANGSTISQYWNGGGSYGSGSITTGRRQLITLRFFGHATAGTDGRGTFTFVNGTKVAEADGLLSSANKVTLIGVGCYNKDTRVAQGMKIYSIRLYSDKLSNDDVATDYNTYGVADYTATVTSDTTLESLTWTAKDGTTTSTMPASYTKLDVRGSGTVTSTSAYAAKMAIANGVTFQPASVSSTAAFFGTGRVLCTAAIPANSNWTDISWTGTLALKDLAFENKQFSSYGNTGSTVELIGVQGYHTERLGASQTWVNPTIKLTNSTTSGKEFGFKSTDGWSDKYTTFNKVTGTGTLTSSGTQTQLFRIADASGFTGSVSMGSRPVVFGTTSTSATSGTITIDSGNTITVGSGATWTASNGIIVNGALTIGSGATVPKIASSSTGSVTVSSGKGTVSGVDGSKFAAKMVVYLGATLAIADTSATALTIPAEFVSMTDFTYYNGGTLDLTGCTALQTLYLDMGSSTTFNLANVSLPATCTTVAVDVGELRSLSGSYTVTKAASGQDGVTIAYAVEETKEEYGNGSLEVTDVPAGATVYVLRSNGTTDTANVTDTTAKLSDYGTVKINGAATAYDVDFAYTGNPLQYKTSSGATLNNVTQVESDWYNYSAANKTTGLKVNKTPYIGGISEFSTLQQEMTLAVVGQMPSVQDNAIFIHLGGSSGTNKGFLIYRLAEDDKVAVAYNEGHDVTDLTTMTVPNAATARHVYIITKVDDTTNNKSVFTIYLDGIKWKTQEVSPVLSMTGGVQIGSDFQAGIRGSDQANGMRIKRVMPSGAAADTAVDTTGYVNVIRIYDRILTKAEIDQYSATEEYPYVSPHGSSVRTFAGSEDWIEDDATDWANTYEETTTHAEAPRAGSALTVNTSDEPTISANLGSTVSYDSLTVNGTGATFAKVNGYGGVISVAGSSVIGAPVTINAGALVLGGPVTITEGGSVTFNYSAYEVASANVIQLTGEMEEAESGKITIIPPTDGHYTYTYGYSGTQYVITPAVAVAVLNHEGTLKGYTTADAALDAAVSGDTVTLQTAYLTPGTHATYAGEKTGVNVVVQGYTIEPVVADGTTTWSTSAYVWTGAGTDSNWTTPANWGLASGYPGSSVNNNNVYTSDAVVFGKNATVTVSSTVYTASITLEDEAVVTFTGDGAIKTAYYNNSGSFQLLGSGEVHMNGITFYVPYATFWKDDGSIQVPLVVDSGANKIYIGGNDNRYGQLNITSTGSLQGSGSIEFEAAYISSSRIYINGDTSSFSGTATFNAQIFDLPVGGSGTWVLGSDDVANAISSISFSGGVLSLPDDVTVDVSAKIAAETHTAAVKVNDATGSREWNAGAVNGSYGFVKNGAGTLTLAQTPAYTGDTVVNAGVLVLPVGTAFSGAVTIAEGAAIQFAGDATWADGSEQTLCTFTTTPDSDTLGRITITGLGERQNYTLDATSGSLVATISAPAITWNGTDGANWTDTGVWLVNGTATSFLSGDKVVFSDASFDGVTEMTVTIPSDVEPASVTIAPGTGNTFVFTGSGKVTTDGLTISVSSGTAKLASDVFSGLDVADEGTVEIDSESANFTLGAVSGSGTLKVTSGSLTLDGTLANTVAIVNNSELTIKDPSWYNVASSITGDGTLVVDGITFAVYDSDISDYTGDIYVSGGSAYINGADGHGSSHTQPFGTGKITLDGANIDTTTSNKFGASQTIPNEIEIVGTGNFIRNNMKAYNNARMELTGSLTGSGEVELRDTQSPSGSKGLVLAGDNSAFAGIATFVTTSSNSYSPTYGNRSHFTGFKTTTAGSANAVWNTSSASKYVGFNVTGTYYLGALNVPGTSTELGIGASGTTVEIGAKADSTINGQFVNNALTLTKVGDTTLTLGSAFAMPSGSTINVTEGKLVTAATTFDGVNFTFANGTELQFTVAEGYEDATSDWELLRTTGTITLTGSQSVTASGSTATGYDWTLKTGTVTDNDVTYNVLYATASQIATWTGNGADNNWDTAGNWSPASVPTQTTPVVFPSGDWTAVITGWGVAKCASMMVDGNLTLAQSDAGAALADNTGNPYNLDLYGNVSGEGTVTLSNAGIWNGSGNTITFKPSLVVAVSPSNEDSQLCGSQVVFNGEVDIQGRLWTKTSGHVFNGATTIQWLTADNARVVFNGDVTLNDGSYVDNYGGYGWAFNGVTVTALGSNGAVFYNGNETEASVTGSGVTFAGKCVFNTWGEAVPVISAPAVLKSGATVSLMNSGTITTYSAETVNHAVEVSADGSYKVYACVIPQANAPAIDMTESSPVTVTTSGVTFAVAADSLIKGLYYRVKAVDGEGNESAAASTEKVKYTGDNASALNFTAPLPTDGVLYYTIEASDSAE